MAAAGAGPSDASGGSWPSDAGMGSDKKRMRRGGRLESEPQGEEAVPHQTREAAAIPAEGEERREHSLGDE